MQEQSVNELGQLPNNVSFTPSAAFDAAAAPAGLACTSYIKQHYVLSEAFDNVMPGSICSYWYQTNSGVFARHAEPVQRRGQHAVPDAELPGDGASG